VPFESANPNASLTPLPQPGVQLAAAINPGMPWMMTYRDDANRLSTEYTAPASASLPTRTKDYYYFGNLLVATQDAASCGRQYYASDHLGTPRLVTNGSAAAVETHNYLPYGEEITSDTTCTPPLQFCAMERDQASGNDYDHARFSLTGMGRFLGVDRHSGNPESPQSWNRYSYAGNNPVNYLDRDGNVSAYAQDVVARPLENAGAALQSAGASLNNGSAGGVVADFVMSTAGDVVGGIGDLFNVGAGSGEAIGSGQDAMAVTSAIASDAGRAGGLLLMMTGAAESTTSVPTETVQRAMSNAEYQSTQSTGLLRGGREGTHFVSDNVNSNALRAQQRLALPQTPEVRATLEVKKGTFGPPTKVQPNFGMPGGGTERTAVGTVKVKIIRKDPL
jgi:RHS repeat-associated protein